VRCPLAGIGTRGPQACNRIALDDDQSSARVDTVVGRIVFANPHRYPGTQIVGDVLILARHDARRRDDADRRAPHHREARRAILHQRSSASDDARADHRL
jgi:hypothetical protein